MDRDAADPTLRPSGSALDVTVVFPCLDEEQSVGQCVSDALTSLRGARLRGEVIVVDNGSVDRSAEIAASAGARVVREQVSGYGAAIGRGIREARAEVVVMADADETYDLSRIPDLVAPITGGVADIVVGSRTADRDAMPILHRFIGTPLITLLLGRACGGLPVRDSQSGFRAFRRQAVLDLNLRCSGMEFASEMLAVAQLSGLRIADIRTQYHRRVGQSKLRTFSDGWRHLRLIFLLAPQILLIYPGIAMVALGLGLFALTLIDPTVLTVGSLRWQPVFFAGILLVPGCQSLLAGAVLARRSTLMIKHDSMRYAFVDRPQFTRLCLTTGMGLVALGFALDFGLFVEWIRGAEFARGTPIASFAQSAIVSGWSLATFALLHRLLQRQGRDGGGQTPAGDLSPVVELGREQDDANAERERSQVVAPP